MSDSTSANIAAHLPATAGRQPYTLAVVYPAGQDRQGRVRYVHFTYRQLDDESDCLARGLEAVGVRRGTRTVLMVKPSLEFFALTFALFKLGAVPVFIDPGMGIKNLGQCLAEAEPEAFIGIPKAQAARLLFGWAKRTLRVIITVGRRWFGGISQVREAGRKGGAFAMAPTEPDTPAAILFTSGSTGVPKGAVYTHGIFNAQVDLLRQTYGIAPGEIDLCTFPLFALFAPALGMTAIIPDMDATRPAHVDPRKIIATVEDFGVTNLFGSPALLSRVGGYGAERNIKLPSLRRVISAGAPVPAAVLERFASMLSPGVQIFTPYGATEALPVSSVGSEEILQETRYQTTKGAGVCVGLPVDPVQVQIIRITDDSIPTWSDDLCLPAGEVGEIVVRGPVVTREYYRRPDLTALAKIADPAGGVYHRMGDLGYFDDRGRLWFCGRRSQRVITKRGTLYTIPCEAVFNAHPRIARTALVGVGPRGAARPVLCVELKDGGRPRDGDTLIKELLALGAAQPHTRDIQSVLFYPGPFPVDVRHNAKIVREKLAAWAIKELS
jgi:acyl-CoA synthetase (AMP-forming)/AMP-acid ligase II